MPSSSMDSIASLLAENARLRAALKPFVAAAAGFRARSPATVISSTAVATITVQHLFNAEAAMLEQ
jgi:hypothetical protein